MKYELKIFYILIFTALGCNNSLKRPTKFYQPDFSVQYSHIYFKDSLISNSLEHITLIKKVIIDDYKKVKSENTNKIAVRLILEYEFGGILNQNILKISTKYASNLNTKYILENDCKALTLDQALFYLTNLENDILNIYLKSNLQEAYN